MHTCSGAVCLQEPAGTAELKRALANSTTTLKCKHAKKYRGLTETGRVLTKAIHVVVVDTAGKLIADFRVKRIESRPLKVVQTAFGMNMHDGSELKVFVKGEPALDEALQKLKAGEEINGEEKTKGGSSRR